MHEKIHEIEKQTDIEEGELKKQVAECKQVYEQKRKEVILKVKEKFSTTDGDNLIGMANECRELFERILV